MPSILRPLGLSYHAAVRVEGVLRASSHPAQEVELLAEKMEVLKLEKVEIIVMVVSVGVDVKLFI